MGKNKSHQKAGKDTQSSDIKIPTKLLFKILQCVHHLANIGLPQEGIKAKAFLKKEKELNNFVKPAQDHPNSDFRGCFQKLTRNYILHTLESLRNHYWARQEILVIEIQNLGISDSDLQIAKEIALKWGRKNFRSKLRTETITKFHQTVQSCTLAKQHDKILDQNPSPHSIALQPLAQEGECNTKTIPTLSPNGSTSLSTPPSTFPSRSITNSPTNNMAMTSTTTLPTLNQPQANTSTKTSNTITKSPPTTPSVILQPINSPTSTTHTNTLQSNTSTTLPITTSSSNSQTNNTTCNHSTTPSKPTTTSIPYLSPQPNTSNNTLSTPHTLSFNPPPITSPSNTSHPLWDPKYNSLNIQGPNNPLSNFYPCKFEFKETTYRDTETAYHDQKAISMGRKDVSIELRSSVDSYKSKEI